MAKATKSFVKSKPCEAARILSQNNLHPSGKYTRAVFEQVDYPPLTARRSDISVAFLP
jgi:hypothetical protein